MRIHVQGTFLLIVLLLAFWGALRWAGPIIDSALNSEDGAVVARAPQEIDDQAGGGLILAEDEPLDGDEIAALQEALLKVGYAPGPVDGILGELTRDAIDEAKEDLELQEQSDRRLLKTLQAALDADSSDSASSGAVAETGQAPAPANTESRTPTTTTAPPTTTPPDTTTPTTTTAPDTAATTTTAPDTATPTTTITPDTTTTTTAPDTATTTTTAPDTATPTTTITPDTTTTTTAPDTTTPSTTTTTTTTIASNANTQATTNPEPRSET